MWKEVRKIFLLSAKNIHKFVEAFFSTKTIFKIFHSFCVALNIMGMLVKKMICIEKQFLLLKRLHFELESYGPCSSVDKHLPPRAVIPNRGAVAH